MPDTYCGLRCEGCPFKDSHHCGGCVATKGHPFHGECPIAVCCMRRELPHCGLCPDFPCKKLAEYSCCDGDNGDNPPGNRLWNCKRSAAEGRPEWRFPAFGHGADYNPDQWRHIPGTFEEDLRLMKLAGCNLMSVGIFSWAALEPEEGLYDFEWLQKVLDGLHENGVSVFLATPTGARPAWMSQKYPEVLRVSPDRRRNLHGLRHNHCYTSPVYREFATRINTALAKRFGNHPAVVGWHVSNEYSGECHCELCQSAFREFLKAKYGSIEALNQAWWTGFWAKTYNDWSQIESPAPQGETAVHGLTLDWKRFVTHQTLDFMRAETEPLRVLAPNLPITTNLMGRYEGLDYFKFSGITDVSSFDAYPPWGSGDDERTAVETAFAYDLTRSLKRKPWILMESTPSMTNWQQVCKPKRPGMHMLSSMQAVAHGADSVQYFQWRKSRGCSEKLHGAVVGHDGTEHTRVFKEVAQVGERLKRITDVLHADVPADAAVIYDWNNRWALKDAQGARKDKQHEEIVTEHYAALRRLGANVDVIDSDQSFEPYRLIAAPMLYMLKPGVAERLEAFVKRGGVLLTTYMSGVVDENDLCFMGGQPGPIRKLVGVWAEELDALFDGQKNRLAMKPDAVPGLEGEYECGFLCELSHAETAETLAEYGDDFYAHRPALTRNRFGEGEAWYLAARTGEDFLSALYAALVERAGVKLALQNLPHGVHAATREKDGKRFLFVMNFTDAEQRVTLPACAELETGARVTGETVLAPLSARILALD